jgi:hypothetical protein
MRTICFMSLSLVCWTLIGWPATAEDLPAMLAEQPASELSAESLRGARCAAVNISTAPSYLLVTIVDSSSGASWTSAVESATLFRALLLESSDWSQLPEGQSNESELSTVSQDPERTREILHMLSRRDSFRFELSNPKAIESLRPWYDGRLLHAARVYLAELTDDEILEESFQDFTHSEGPAASGRRRFALAHALLERGFFPSRGCVAPHLYVSLDPCQRR